MSEEKSKAVFITFYSFKGGVGRSMALINTAGILAGRGFRVLVIDLDLEAPGLSYLDPDAPDISPAKQMPRQRPLQPGFVDLLSDAKERGEAADLFALSADEVARRYTQIYHLPEELRNFKDGSLQIMPAGKFDGHYGQRLDNLNLHELYQEGLGEPLIRAFKKKLAEADLYDFVLVDSRTGFSDEAGICTRDLADHLMILSGLNRQNIQGTCEFLKALRAATDGMKSFQIILSPVPNGEDALLDQREAMAKASFEAAWGAEVDLSLQIPYHPQLALTEEPHIFRRRRGYLFEAYRAIERHMLTALGHDPRTLLRRIKDTLRQKDYSAAFRDLRYMVRLDSGRSVLLDLAFELGTDDRRFSRHKGGELNEEQITLDNILGDAVGCQLAEFTIDHLPLGEKGSGISALLHRLENSSVDLADRLYKRIIGSTPSDTDILSDYAFFLLEKRADLDGAEEYFKHALEVDPENARTLINYASFLTLHRGARDKAESYYQRALETDPKRVTMLRNYEFMFAQYPVEIDGAEEYYKRALEANPEDPDVLATYAAFLAWKRGTLDRAEVYYQRALAVTKRPTSLLFGNYGTFLAWQSGDLIEAEEYFKRALEVDPKSAGTLNNYGQLLVGFARLSEGERSLLSAYHYHDRSQITTITEVCFSLWLVFRMQGHAAERWERHFKFLIQKGFKRYPWSFARMLDQAKKVLSPEEFEYAEALARAFLDEGQVANLEQYERWRALEPLSLWE